jgi:hypothetical protein
VSVRSSACDRHRDVLLAFVDRRETGPATDAALDHLRSCRGCMRDLEATAMAVATLRRLHVESRAVEPPPDSWARVRARVDRPRGPVWRWRASLAGLAVGAGLVGAILAPVSVWSHRGGYLQEPGTDAAVFDARRLAEQLDEALVLDRQRLVRSAPPPPGAERDTPAPSALDVGWTGPDGLGVGMRATAGLEPVERSR